MRTTRHVLGDRAARLAVALAGALTWSSPAAAQVPDLIDVSAQTIPNVALHDVPGASVQVASYDVTLNVPIPIDDATFLIPGATYHADATSFSGAPEAFVQLRAFHAVDASLLFVRLLPHDWSLSLRAAAGLAGDFASVDTGLLRVNALAMATHGFSDDLVVGGGALVGYAFGSFLPLPAAYVDWKAPGGWRVEAFLPAFVHARVELFDRLEIGYRADVSGNAYAVRDERIADRWPCGAQAADDPATPEDERQARPDACFDHLAYSVVAAGPTVSVRLFETVWANAFVGHTLYRRFDRLNADDDIVPDDDTELPRSWMVRAGLSWRVPMP